MYEVIAETFEVNGRKVEIVQDDSPTSPREWDNPTTMICFHRDYELGDKHDLSTEDYEGWSEVADAVRERYNVVGPMLPLYLLDHSGITMRIGASGNPFHEDPGAWDSGMVGFIFNTREGLDKCWGEGETPDDDTLNKILREDVATYAQYLEGDVWGYVIYKPKQTCSLGHVHEDVDDSCWGFYGVEAAKEEATGIAEGMDADA